EFPFARLDSFLTPTHLHYVRNHYQEQAARPPGWKLGVVGAVKKPLTFTLAELQKLTWSKRPLTLECAGNGRGTLSAKGKGVEWAVGAVSRAEWTGVALAEVLDRAGVQSGAVEVLLEAADAGDPKKEGQPPTPVTFCRSLPLEKARKPEVILAWGMGGK